MMTAENIEALDHDSFDYLRVKLQQTAGISLAESKHEMLLSRLRKRLLHLRMSSYTEYVSYLKSLPQSHDEWQVFINVLTTNKTDFFREPEHFQYLLKNVLPQWQEKRRDTLRIWSAACSTGEEPYTLSMVLHNAQRTTKLDYAIAASDIDTEVLSYAKNGVYRRSRLIEIPEDFQRSSITLGSHGIDDWMKIKLAIKKPIMFKQCNLVSPPYPWEYAFDIVFCRNVLIYFSTETVQEVVHYLYEAAKPGAFLFVGHSESLHNITSPWQYVKPSIYRKIR